MDIDIQFQEHLVRVSLRGPCTLMQATDLQYALEPLAGKTTAVIVELDQITELDSYGLQVLLSLRQDCPTVFFCYANSLVQKKIADLNLHQAFHAES